MLERVPYTPPHGSPLRFPARTCVPQTDLPRPPWDHTPSPGHPYFFSLALTTFWHYASYLFVLCLKSQQGINSVLFTAESPALKIVGDYYLVNQIDENVPWNGLPALRGGAGAWQRVPAHGPSLTWSLPEETEICFNFYWSKNRLLKTYWGTTARRPLGKPFLRNFHGDFWLKLSFAFHGSLTIQSQSMGLHYTTEHCWVFSLINSLPLDWERYLIRPERANPWLFHMA